MGTNFLVGPVVVGNGGNGFKLKENRFKLGSFYKKSYVVKHWNRLPRAVIDEQTAEDAPVHCRVGWTRWPLKVPFQPKVCDSVIFLPPTLQGWRWEWERRIELPAHLWTELSFLLTSGFPDPRRSSGCSFWGKTSASSHIFPFSTDFLWTNLWNTSQNVSFQWDHSLEKFSIQSIKNHLVKQVKASCCGF